METVALRIPTDLERSLKRVMRVEHLDRSVALRKLLEIGSQEWRKDFAVRKLMDGKMTVWKAAKLSGISVWEMLDLVRERGISLPIKAEDVIEDIREAMKE